MRITPTTERIIEEEKYQTREDYLIYLIHIATYKYVIRYITNKKVLDYGCGSGYGTALVSKYCENITGIDVSSEAISFAKATYNESNLSFLTVKKAEEAPLPFFDEAFDVVLSFQVVEHIQDTTAYFREINRVLKPCGKIIIATPDRTSRLFPFQKPWNRWHIREYSQKQLYTLLEKTFSDVKINQLGGREDMITIELSRTKKLKWFSLPFTLPIIPEIIRINSLRILQYWAQRIPRSKKTRNVKIDDTAISISNNEKISIDLIAVANKK
jgi:ubiquinone/menaquinone biosynthesis C-methylase UbiE